MSTWTVEDVAAALGVVPVRAPAAADWLARGVSTDTRSLRADDLFVCLRGERTDGHDYIQQALAAGAAGLIVEEARLLGGTLEFPPPTHSLAVFSVPDALVGLQELARYHRARLSATVLGITGSNGKTSSKEMCYGLLAGVVGAERVFATQGNLNNHIGLPLSILATRGDEDYVVLEMGMNHAGEIALLSEIARPHHALITSVAAVHIEFFADSGVAGIARAKLEIVDGLAAGGTLVFDAGSPGVELARARAAAGGARLVLFSRPALLETPGGAGVAFDWSGQRVSAPAYANPVMAGNLLGCLELLAAAGLDPQALARAAAAVAPLSRRRFETIHKPRPGGREPQILVDDSYNANPASFCASIAALRQLLPYGRLGCFAGPMAELGPEHGPAGHREVGAALAAAGYEFLAVHGGEAAEQYLSAFGQAGTVLRADSVEGLKAALAAGEVDVAAFDGILVKGSRSARMDVVSDTIRNQSYV